MTLMASGLASGKSGDSSGGWGSRERREETHQSPGKASLTTSHGHHVPRSHSLGRKPPAFQLSPEQDPGWALGVSPAWGPASSTSLLRAEPSTASTSRSKSLPLPVAPPAVMETLHAPALAGKQSHFKMNQGGRVTCSPLPVTVHHTTDGQKYSFRKQAQATGPGPGSSSLP